ncbi:protein-disulfide reductase DsbD family protein [Pseudoteredinibacter isoporae]|uniref:Thiol:disulfide interchange protein DsbD n=1 Tax=Pseudoteredinibacter isoporae TaxID=570281 RepID=A0A7X0JQV9_9GAMM|nr:protein-disulfide reductase DsbD [Pseudoteredinibacter isoporae]MBB6519746.1 thiol:disulfide interchange protein DsbD [Pseudoteredinibacter isoporae]NHO85327.1 protein-disulfide reductase DsbD [Pseudoteredinibacter isoporae]NIB26221.1 protein-disulfide reductase DsbD [Pseudoteredinibacter isoporae]
MSFSTRFRICFVLLCLLANGTAWGQESQASPFALNPEAEQSSKLENNNAQSGFGLEPAKPVLETPQSDSATSLSSAFSVADNSQPVDFLPIDQAYQAAVFFSEGKLNVDWQIADGYYLYKDRFKFQQHENSGTAPLNAEFEVGKRIFDQVFEKELEVYYHNTQIKLQSDASDSNQYRLAVEFQGCADAGLCYPPHTLWYTVNTESGNISEAPAPASDPGNRTPGSDAAQGSLLSALVLAFLGGLILNLMPCVFPVLSIKALSLAEASNSPASKQLHGWSYTAGAVVSFVAIAALMLILKSSGQAIGWGFQLQSPIFVSLLAYLFFAMGLSLAGLAEFGNRLMGVGQQLTQKSGYQGSFFTGVLACVVASPCTAPFMGTALGFALGQSAGVALSVFAALGFGMAAPFLLLSYLPKLGNYLPKPGPWMETFKQALAFPLFVAAIWLLWVLGRQAGGDAVALSLLGLTLIAFALWLLRYQGVFSKAMALVSIVLALALPGLMSSLSTQSSTETEGFWQTYSKGQLDKALANQQSVFINATAAWCLTCLANERIAFSEAFEKQLQQQGTVAMKADWTNYDANITALLQSHGRNGVPLYVFYNRGEVKILPQLLTEDILLEGTKAN